MGVSSSTRFQRQRGSGDSFAIIGVVLICTVVSVVLMLLNWVKTTKDARLQSDYELNMPEGRMKRKPHGYQVIY